MIKIVRVNNRVRAIVSVGVRLRVRVTVVVVVAALVLVIGESRQASSTSTRAGRRAPHGVLPFRPRLIQSRPGIGRIWQNLADVSKTSGEAWPKLNSPKFRESADRPGGT